MQDRLAIHFAPVRHHGYKNYLPIVINLVNDAPIPHPDPIRRFGARQLYRAWPARVLPNPLAAFAYAAL